MPRTARVDSPGAVHHVMLRGVARAAVFSDDADRARFLDLLKHTTADEGVRCYAYALMPNHIHAVLRSGRAGISRMMARVGTAYAMAFNRRHDRVGHLFQARFKSVLVDSDTHRLWLVRYVHRNPIEAGIVESVDRLAGYRWTGHAELLGRAPADVVAVKEVLSWFAPGPAEAITRLDSWMRDGEASLPPADEIAADPSLVKQAVERTIERVCRDEGVSVAALRSGSRTQEASRARALIVYRLRRELGLSPTAIERALGLSSGAAARALRRAENLVR